MGCAPSVPSGRARRCSKVGSDAYPRRRVCYELTSAADSGAGCQAYWVGDDFDSEGVVRGESEAETLPLDGRALLSPEYDHDAIDRLAEEGAAAARPQRFLTLDAEALLSDYDDNSSCGGGDYYIPPKPGNPLAWASMHKGSTWQRPQLSPLSRGSMVRPFENWVYPCDVDEAGERVVPFVPVITSPSRRRQQMLREERVLSPLDVSPGMSPYHAVEAAPAAGTMVMSAGTSPWSSPKRGMSPALASSAIPVDAGMHGVVSHVDLLRKTRTTVSAVSGASFAYA